MKQTGGCHCGNVRYEAEMELKNGISCNCSMCMKRGTLLDFIPEDKFKILKGEEHLKKYQFNKHVIDHLFCDNCGILSFARGATPDGKKMIAINLRCLDGFELSKIKIQEFDGRSH
jgi:Uncharacterized conserved protein